MYDKEFILNEIRKQAAFNNGTPLGIKKFSKITGIKEHSICGRYWARWSDAIREAGLPPNHLSKGYEKEFLMQKICELIRELGKVPSTWELEHKAFMDSTFPGPGPYRRMFLNKFALVKAILDYCEGNGSLADVSEICTEVYNKGMAEDKAFAENNAEYKAIALVKSGKNLYRIITQEKPFMINTLKLSGTIIVHQVPTNSIGFGLPSCKESFKQFLHKSGKYKLGKEQIKKFKSIDSLIFKNIPKGSI